MVIGGVATSLPGRPRLTVDIDAVILLSTDELPGLMGAAAQEGLIILKAVAHRFQDLLDIQALIEANPNLDRERIQSWVLQFAEALDMPELWTDIAPWL